MGTIANPSEEQILRSAVESILDPSFSPADLDEQLGRIDPELASFATWRALTTLERFLPAGTSWSVRVRSLRRRSFYAHSIALETAARVSEQLTLTGTDHAMYGDLALAMRHPNPGDRPVHAVSISIAEDADLETLRDALSAVPKVVIDHVDSHRLLGRIEAIDLRIEKGWLPCPWYRRVPLTDQVIEQPESNPSTDQPIPLLTDAAEIIRLLELAGSGATDQTWPLDIARLDASDAPRLTTELGRTAFLVDQWDVATELGLLRAQPRPKPRRSPTERLKRATRSQRSFIRRPARVAVGLVDKHPRHK
jgi:hypothetical protein